MIEPLTIPKFLAGWLPALALSVHTPEPGARLSELFLVDFGGLTVPVVTCALGALGIAASRPFTHRAEQDLGWKLRWLVTAIMLVTVQLWILESRPGWLFAFVVSIGMGFAGFSLLELFGEQVKDFVRRAFAGAADTIGRDPGGKGPDGK